MRQRSPVRYLVVKWYVGTGCRDRCVFPKRYIAVTACSGPGVVARFTNRISKVSQTQLETVIVN